MAGVKRAKKWSLGEAAALLLALALIAAAGALFLSRPAPTPAALDIPELGLEGYVPVEINLTDTTVILTAECRQIEAGTTEAQTFSIAKGLEGRLDFRPTTHDLLQDLMDHYGIVPLQARIDRYDAETGTYYAQLVVRSGERTLSLDARPTDAMGVAVRYGLPVHMNRAVLEQQGERVC